MKKTAKLLTQATEIVMNDVRITFQTYVESLKDSGGFGKEEQLVALNKAKTVILPEMTEELKNWITANYGDLSN